MAEFHRPIKNAEPGAVIDWTPEKLARFRRHHANALADDKETFVFDEHGFLTSYAGYLLVYLKYKLT